MIVFLNGEFVPEERAVVSVFDRCFRYGDGLFEAVLVRNEKPFRWQQHIERLESGARALRFPWTCSAEQLWGFARELFSRNGVSNGVLRLQLSRGVGERGYAPTGREKPVLVMTVHEAPPLAGESEEPWALTICSARVAAEGWAQYKTCSRLIQVLAAMEARERGADEALVLNSAGELAEGSTSNVFWISGGTVGTPPVQAGALPGITRAVVLELCREIGIPVEEHSATPKILSAADGVFLSLTTRGIVEAGALDGMKLRRSDLVQRLQKEFRETVARECSRK